MDISRFCRRSSDRWKIALSKLILLTTHGDRHDPIWTLDYFLLLLRPGHIAWECTYRLSRYHLTSNEWFISAFPLKKIPEQATDHLTASPIRHFVNLVTAHVNISRSRMIRSAVEKRIGKSIKRGPLSIILYSLFFSFLYT